MHVTPLSFPNRDNVSLSAELVSPGKAPLAYAIFAHCFTCGKNTRSAQIISQSLASAGIAVLRFDFAGLGRSEGSFADSNFSSNLDDLSAAAEFLENNYQAPEILVGHSLGGTAVLHVAHRLDSVKAVVTIGSPATAEHVTQLIGSIRKELKSNGEAKITLAGREFLFKQQFIDDLQQQPQSDHLSRLRKALLILHSPLDELVAIANATEVFVNAKHPKSFVTLDNANHLLTDPADAHYAGQIIAAWVSRYIETLDVADRPIPTQLDTVVVKLDSDDGFYSRINANGYELIADEPLKYGGTDLGPTPYDLLASALASCVAMTVQMYARKKEFDLKSIDVFVHHNKIHAQDCASCETTAGQIDRFELKIKLTGPLTDEQKQRCLDIAGRCPVHRTLNSEVSISKQLV